MHSYRRTGTGKATASTLCQKCLKRGHYTYECTAAQQDRPYTSRPSRSQQLSNPKLVPKLTNDAPKEAKVDEKEKLKDTDKPEVRANRTQPRKERSSSVSSYTSGSVSSYSSSGSRAHSVQESGRRTRLRSRSSSVHSSGYDDRLGKAAKRDDGYGADESRTYRGRSTSPRPPRTNAGRSRSPLNQSHRRERRETTNTKQRHLSSTSADGHQTGRSSWMPGRRSRSPDEHRAQARRKASPSIQRKRSLSPYSQRVAMTRGGMAG